MDLGFDLNLRPVWSDRCLVHLLNASLSFVVMIPNFPISEPIRTGYETNYFSYTHERDKQNLRTSRRI